MEAEIELGAPTRVEAETEAEIGKETGQDIKTETETETEIETEMEIEDLEVLVTQNTDTATLKLCDNAIQVHSLY